MKIVNKASLPTDPTVLRHIRNAGITLIIIGIIAVALPHFATLAVELLLAWTLVIGGAIGLFFGWRGRDFLTWWHTGVTFLLTLILGIVFLVYPFEGIQDNDCFCGRPFLSAGNSFIVACLSTAIFGSSQLDLDGIQCNQFVAHCRADHVGLARVCRLGHWPAGWIQHAGNRTIPGLDYVQGLN